MGVSVELPFFDTRGGQLNKAQSDVRTAAARSKIVLAETRATIQQLAETVQRRQTALAYFQTDLEPRFPRLKSMSADAYLMGKHTILELIDANQARREVELEHIETLVSLIEAQIRFLAVTGRLSEYSHQFTQLEHLRDKTTLAEAELSRNSGRSGNYPESPSSSRGASKATCCQ